ncbi:hypothetical protein BGW80DRAFT_1258332 [Lactifluus volemus]|nr:hypothetical protein BGW80DRAFT_1258332 [Lactifluus volemus]
MANVILAQKAKDGKIFWVEFTSQYHAHLVKCAVALVPRPLQKKHLTERPPKPFSTSQRAQASWPKPRRRRNVLQGKGTTHRGENADEQLKKPLEADHNGPAKNVDSRKGGEAKGKGNSKTPTTSNKPKAPTKSWTAPPTHHVDPPPTSALEAAKQCTPDARVVVVGPATYFEQPTNGVIGSCHSTWLNTAKKRGTHKRVMKSVIDKP